MRAGGGHAAFFVFFASHLSIHLLFTQRISPGSRDCAVTSGGLAAEGAGAGGGAGALLSLLLFSCLTSSLTPVAAAAAAPTPPAPPAPAPLTSTGVKAASPEAGDAVLWRVSVFLFRKELRVERESGGGACQFFFMKRGTEREREQSAASHRLFSVSSSSSLSSSTDLGIAVAAAPA